MKILILKLGAVGDTIMALSMLEAIDRLFPASRITWVCGESVEPLIRVHGRVDEIIVVNERRLLKGGVLGASTQLIPLWLRLFGKTFDLIATGHSDVRYGLLSLTAKGKIRRSFGNVAGRQWPLSGRYHANEYVRLITGEKGFSTSVASLPFFKTEVPEKLSGALISKQKIVALAPGGAKNVMRENALRRWPLASYARLAEFLIKDGFSVLLLGSESDDWVRGAFNQLPVKDLVGKTGLEDLLALLSRVHLTITHDSGPMHLALASRTPVIALFGPTSPLSFTPVSDLVHVLWGGEHLACRPCYDGRNFDQCENNQCLKSISVESVYLKAKKVLHRD